MKTAAPRRSLPILGSALACCAGTVQARTNIYVNAACGDDAWTGAAQICQVPDGPKRTIQAAIAAATNGDSVLVATGTYVEHINFLGKAIAVRAAPGATPTIGGSSTGLVVSFVSNESSASSLEGFTITGGVFTLPGGGIKIQSASPTIRSCTITGNRADEGGGILIVSGSPLIESCLIRDNRADSGGGILIRSGSPTIVQCTITQNRAQDNFGVGGGIGADSASPIIRNCTINGNFAGAVGYGGGMSLTNCQTLIDDCTISGNHVDRAGGLNVNGGTLRLVRSTIDSNGATGEGGLYIRGGSTVTIADCLISRNTAAYFGSSAIGVTNATCSLVNCTIANNRGYAEPIAAVDSRTGTASLSNCILWGNFAQNTNVQALGPTITFSDVQGGFPGAGNINSDPLFAGTPAGDFALLSASPCIDAGSNPAYFASPGATFTDLVGKPRGFDVQSAPDTGVGLAPLVDMGSYESQGPAPCYANCDNSTTAPILNVNDFICFLNKFATGCP